MHANPERVKQYRERGQQIARLESEIEKLTLAFKSCW
jgi:hypothetical protein